MLMDNSRCYCCHRCGNQVSRHDDIISKDYVSHDRRAFLFYNAMNTSLGPEEVRIFISGRYMVRDVSCGDCQETLGWKYEHSYQQSQKGKVGKIVLEKSKIVKDW